MKKVIIGALVGALIAFFYQALSWMVLPTHTNAIKYTEHQDEILNLVNSRLTEEAVYHIPTLPPGASMEDHEKFAQSIEGKPYLQLTYHKSASTSMGAPMATGFVLAFLSMLIISLILYHGSASFKTFGNCFWVAFGIFMFALLEVRVTDWNWWHTPMSALSGDLIDLVVAGVLVGLWMGWYFKAKASDAYQRNI